MKTHLTIEERNTILTGVRQGCDKTTIAKMVGKDKSTISLEIKKHRKCTYVTSLPKECDNYKKCKYGRKCTDKCPDFKPFYCKRRDRTPGVCNGCSNYKSCRFTKYSYDPNYAQNQYKEMLTKSREGVNQTEETLESIAEIVVPLLLMGQSPYVIVENHPELNITEKTLYNYIDLGLFKKWNVV